MLESAEAIVAFSKGKKRNDLDHEQMFLFSILRALEILGEAAGKVTKKTQNQFSDIPWK